MARSPGGGASSALGAARRARSPRRRLLPRRPSLLPGTQTLLARDAALLPGTPAESASRARGRRGAGCVPSRRPATPLASAPSGTAPGSAGSAPGLQVAPRAQVRLLGKVSSSPSQPPGAEPRGCPMSSLGQGRGAAALWGTAQLNVDLTLSSRRRGRLFSRSVAVDLPT